MYGENKFRLPRGVINTNPKTGERNILPRTNACKKASRVKMYFYSLIAMYFCDKYQLLRKHTLLTCTEKYVLIMNGFHMSNPFAETLPDPLVVLERNKEAFAFTFTIKNSF